MSEGHASVLREDARAAIIAAAEALYQRGGAEAVSLSAVAREADFARGVVYAHFGSRLELLRLVAPEEELPTAADSPEPESGEHETAAEVPVEKPIEEPVEPQSDSEAESYDTLMRAQAEALQELSKQVIVPKPRTPTDTALSRLDARMAAAESSLKAIEQRLNERDKSFDVDTSALAERLHGLRQRLEKFEEKQTTALAQLRLDVHNLRYDPAAPVAAPVMMPEPVPEIAIEPANSDESTDEGTEPPSEGADTSSSRIAAYLVTARRAANEAAVRRAAMPVKHKPAWLRFIGRRRWALLAVAAALVVWFDVYVFAHYQPAEGAAYPPPAATPVTPPPLTAKPEWSPRAQLVRGLRYLNGTGVPVDLAKAHLWIERAALRGHPVAANLLGVMYQTGTGVTVNLPVAIGWYEGAADKGNLKAMTNLGKLYAGGWREGTDFAKASEWFAKAAAYGDVDAAFDLAILYERGEGVVRNIPQAYKWYAIAGRLGDKNAAARAATLASALSPEEQQAADAAIESYRPKTMAKDANETPPVSG